MQEQKEETFKTRTYDETTVVKTSVDDRRRWIRELEQVSRLVKMNQDGSVVVIFDPAKLAGKK